MARYSPGRLTLGWLAMLPPIDSSSSIESERLCDASTHEKWAPCVRDVRDPGLPPPALTNTVRPSGGRTIMSSSMLSAPAPMRCGSCGAKGRRHRAWVRVLQTPEPVHKIRPRSRTRKPQWQRADGPTWRSPAQRTQEHGASRRGRSTPESEPQDIPPAPLGPENVHRPQSSHIIPPA
jgi:hypothetical protein